MVEPRPCFRSVRRAVAEQRIAPAVVLPAPRDEREVQLADVMRADDGGHRAREQMRVRDCALVSPTSSSDSTTDAERSRQAG